MEDSEKISLKDLNPLRSFCPLSVALDITGDRWTILVMRDMLMGKTKYKEFQHSPESIPTNILASRLKKMLGDGLIDKKLYQEKPKRYEYFLTRKGRDYVPILQELVKWSLKHYEGCFTPPQKFWDL